MTLSWRASTTIRPPTAQLLGTFSSNTAHIPINYQPPFHHRLSSGLRTPKSLLQRLQVPIWRIAIAVSQPAKQGHCKCMTVKRIVRCFANSLNLLGNFNDFALLSRWYSCAKQLLHVSNESCSSQQNKLFCRANQFTLQSKSICFTEQINLLCIRICCMFIWNICFSTYYTAPRNTVNNSPQARRLSWLFCG